MKISTKGRYALEIMVDLALNSDIERPESLRNIASRRGLSEKYLERIMRGLKKGGLILSLRGASGGYCLARQPGEITVREVLNATEGLLAPVECLTKEKVERKECKKCPTRSVWSDMWDIILRTTEEISIEQIIKTVKQGKSFQ